VAQQIDDVKAALGVNDVVCCLTDPKSNFRKELVDPGYKAGRKKSRKPVGYTALTSWVKETYRSFMKPGLEADDCMGVLSTLEENKGKCIIVSSDKDMRTIPGTLYIPDKQEKIVISEADAEAFFLTQCLAGDPVDSIKGLPGVGPVKAQNILGTRPHWGAVEAAYIKAGYTRDDAIKQARLVRILRREDWDAKKGEPILWKPSDTKRT